MIPSFRMEGKGTRALKTETGRVRGFAPYFIGNGPRPKVSVESRTLFHPLPDPLWAGPAVIRKKEGAPSEAPSPIRLPAASPARIASPPPVRTPWAGSVARPPGTRPGPAVIPISIITAINNRRRGNHHRRGRIDGRHIRRRGRHVRRRGRDICRSRRHIRGRGIRRPRGGDRRADHGAGNGTDHAGRDHITRAISAAMIMVMTGISIGVGLRDACSPDQNCSHTNQNFIIFLHISSLSYQ